MACTELSRDESAASGRINKHPSLNVSVGTGHREQSSDTNRSDRIVNQRCSDPGCLVTQHLRERPFRHDPSVTVGGFETYMLDTFNAPAADGATRLKGAKPTELFAHTQVLKDRLRRGWQGFAGLRWSSAVVDQRDVPSGASQDDSCGSTSRPATSDCRVEEGRLRQWTAPMPRRRPT